MQMPRSLALIVLTARASVSPLCTRGSLSFQRATPRALPFSSSQGPVRKKQRGRGSQRPVESELMLAQIPRATLSPHREVSPVLFSQPDQRPSASVSDLVSFGGSDDELADDSMSLAASDAEELSGSVTDPAPSRLHVRLRTRTRSPSLMLRFPLAAFLDLRWKDSLSASRMHRRRHRLCDTSCPSAPAQQLLRVAPRLRRLSSPRSLHLPFPPLSLLGLSRREGVHAQPDATPFRSARAPDPR